MTHISCAILQKILFGIHNRLAYYKSTSKYWHRLTQFGTQIKQVVFILYFKKELSSVSHKTFPKM